jgi:hypothetical protein
MVAAYCTLVSTGCLPLAGDDELPIQRTAHDTIPEPEESRTVNGASAELSQPMPQHAKS